MTKPDFVYVTYIATTPQKVFQALVDTEVTRKYWVDPRGNDLGHVNVSDWEVGSKWEHRRLDDAHTADIAGTVIESTPPHRLIFTWARPAEFDDKTKHSRVTFDIEPHGDGVVRLVVTHEGLENDPKMLAGISGGWPTVLSNLKTFLETGQPLPHSPAAS